MNTLVAIPACNPFSLFHVSLSLSLSLSLSAYSGRLTQEFHIIGIGKIGIFGAGAGRDGRLRVGNGRHFGVHGKMTLLSE